MRDLHVHARSCLGSRQRVRVRRSHDDVARFGVLTVELNVNLLAAAAGERVVATGIVLRDGRALTVCRGDAHADGVHVATMLATMIRYDLVPVRGSDADWYKNVLKTPTIRVAAGGAQLRANARPISDAVAVNQVLDKFRAK
jgi:hypothetical protein